MQSEITINSAFVPCNNILDNRDITFFCHVGFTIDINYEGPTMNNNDGTSKHIQLLGIGVILWIGSAWMYTTAESANRGWGYSSVIGKYFTSVTGIISVGLPVLLTVSLIALVIRFLRK
jgi:hypothetical protein